MAMVYDVTDGNDETRRTDDISLFIHTMSSIATLSGELTGRIGTSTALATIPPLHRWLPSYVAGLHGIRLAIYRGARRCSPFELLKSCIDRLSF